MFPDMHILICVLLAFCSDIAHVLQCRERQGPTGQNHNVLITYCILTRIYF